MKVRCQLCKHEIEFSELDFNPGDLVSVECPRCGSSKDVVIPAREEEKASAKSIVKVTKVENDNQTIVEPAPSKEEVVMPPTEAIEATDVVLPSSPSPVAPKRNKKQSGTSGVTGASKSSKPKSSVAEQSKSNSSTKKTTPQSKRKNSKTVSVSNVSVKTNPPAEKPETISGCGCLIIILILICCGVAFWLWLSSDSSTEDEHIEITSAESYLEEDNVAKVEYYEDNVSEMDNNSEVEEVVISLDSISDLTPSKDTMNNPMRFKEGVNSFLGDMIHTDGRRFPFTLEFNYSQDNDSISDVKYCNVSSGTKLNLTVCEYTSEIVRCDGKDAGKLFRIEFSGSDPYYGDAWWGDFHQSVELHYKN